MPDTTDSREWLVIIDPQIIFTDSALSPWASDMWPQIAPQIVELAKNYRDRIVVTRFVADTNLGGSWSDYYREWSFALVGGDDPLYSIVPDLADLTDRVITEPTFGKWGDQLCAITGDQPRLALAGVSTDCCVISTALAAGEAGAWVRVIGDACAGSTRKNHRQALNAMRLFSPQIVVI